MAITLTTTSRTIACNAVVDLVDVGSSNSQIELRNALGDTIVTIQLPNPAFGAASSGVATANGLPLTGTAWTGGVLTTYAVYSRSEAIVWTGTIGTSAADMIVDNTTIATGQAITITSWTHTHPA